MNTREINISRAIMLLYRGNITDNLATYCAERLANIPASPKVPYLSKMTIRRRRKRIGGIKLCFAQNAE